MPIGYLIRLPYGSHLPLKGEGKNYALPLAGFTRP